MSGSANHGHKGRGTKQPAIAVGQGCVLHPFSPADAAELMIAVQDPLIRRYTARLIDDRAQALDAIQGWQRRWAHGLGGVWALRTDGPGGQLLGSVLYAVLDEDLSNGSVGYWLTPQARGLGLASASVARSCPVIFERMGWFRIELSHAVENERSCAVARRAGFAPEGVLRSVMVYPIDGRRSDEHLHARLRTDQAS